MGQNKSPIYLDPALMKMYKMSNQRYLHFKWTPRTLGITLMYAVVVPSIFGYMALTTDGKYELRGKRRGDSILEY